MITFLLLKLEAKEVLMKVQPEVELVHRCQQKELSKVNMNLRLQEVLKGDSKTLLCLE